jgi:hypothetical protein
MESATKINDTYYTNEEILIEQSSDEKPKKPLKKHTCSKIRPFLRKVSVGQYYTKLYNDGKTQNPVLWEALLQFLLVFSLPPML